MWNLKNIQALLAAGKIRGYTLYGTAQSPPIRGRGKKNQNSKRGDVAKDWLTLFLLAWCQERAYFLNEEFRFHDERKWRFDYAIRAVKIAVEYEGLGFQKTGHTTSEGYTANTDKYNTAAAAGWTVFRVTYKNYMTLPKQLEAWEQTHKNGK